MNEITATVIKYMKNKTLQQLSQQCESLKEEYEKRRKEYEYLDNKLLNQIDFIDKNEMYQIDYIYIEIICVFNSFYDDDSVLVIYNEKDKTIDVYNLKNKDSMNKVNKISDEKISQIKHLFNSNSKIDFVITAANNYQIVIYTYKEFNIKILKIINNETICSKTLFTIAPIEPLQYINSNYILKFNQFHTFIQMKSFDNELISEMNISTDMKHIEQIDKCFNGKKLFFTWYNNGISTYEMKNKKIYNVCSFSSVNKGTNAVSYYVDKDDRVCLLEGNFNSIIIWDFYKGNKIKQIPLSVLIGNINQILLWNENIFYIGTDNGSLLQFRINDTKIECEKYNKQYENVFILKKCRSENPCLILLNSIGEVIMLK